MKKDMTEEKQKLETDNRSNEEVQKLITQNTEVKEQIPESDFSEYTVEKTGILFKRAKEIRGRGEFAKIIYNRLVSYQVRHAPSI